MAGLQKTYSGHPDALGNIARQLWMARNVASAARKESQAWADINPDLVKGVTPMFGRGQIFGRELQRRATSRLPRRFQRQLLGPRDYWLTGQSTVDPLMGVGKDTKSGGALRDLPEYQNIAHPDERAYKSNVNKVPKAPTTTNTAKKQKGVQVNDKQLGNFLAAVALSLNSSLNSINNKMDEASEGIIVAKDGIDLTYKKLEENTDSIESKLDSIIDALKHSNRAEEDERDQKEISAKRTEQRKANDMSTATRVIMQDMDKEEIRAMQEEDRADDDRGPIDDGTSTEPQNEKQLEIPYAGEFAEGGIASGPDSGYLAVLHGDEAVIPLDNNYTQGEQTALNNPVTPDTPMLERGNIDSMKPKMLPWGGMKRPPATVKPKDSMGVGNGETGETLAQAIQLPSKAAGLVTMGIMNKVLKQGNLSPKVINHLKSMSAPIAAAFGVPDVMSADLLSDTTGEGREDFSGTGKGKKRRERGLFGRFKDWVTGNNGTGGGNVSYRGGTGGNTYVNNRSTGTGGGYGTGGFFGGKKDSKPSDAIEQLRYKSDHPLGTAQPNPFREGTTLYKNFERMRTYDMHGMTISSAGGDSQLFTKNVSYQNAFDYNKFESPEYGLKVSEIAYNMSMEDEISSLIEGISDPSSQVVVNNKDASTDANNQIHHSPIAVRGNPLKEGTYLSPYSV